MTGAQIGLSIFVGWVLLWIAAGAIGALALYGLAALVRWIGRAGDDLEALIELTRECRACSPQDIGECTCTEPCGHLRCTVGYDDVIDLFERETRTQ